MTTTIPTAPPAAPSTRANVKAVQIRVGGLVDALWAAAPVIVGAAVLAGGWQGWVAPVVILVAALLPLALIPLAVRLRVSAWTAAAIVILATVAGAYLISRSSSASTSVVVDALPRLLTAPFPAPARPDLIAPGVLVAVVVSSFVGVRLTRPGRQRVSPVIAGATLYTGGLLLTAGRADPYGVAALALAVVSALGWLFATRPGARAGSSRGVGRALPVLAIMGAVVLATAVPARTSGFEPRELVTPPHQDIQAMSPLPQLAAWGRDPERPLFQISGDVYPLHLVTLTDFDGSSWSAPTRYQSLGGTDKASLPAGFRRSPITVDISHINLSGPWVPAPGTPTSVSDGAAVVDPETGSLVISSRGDDTAYRVSGVVDAPDEATLRVSEVPTGPEVARYLAVPDLPAALSEYARSVTRDAGTALDKAIAIEGAVRGSRTVSAKAPTGSSYFRIQAFLFADKATPDGQAGTSEQFATAFAILARRAGLPTRLVTGFLPGTPDATGQRVVKGRDALAWPEVYFTGVGWVPFSPTPDTGRFGPDLQDRTPVGSKASTSGAPVATPGGKGSGGVVVVNGQAAQSSSPLGWVAGLVLLGVGGPLIGLYAARRARRGRHRRAGARGAWSQLLDVLRLRGDRAGGGQPAVVLADLLDRASAGDAPARRVAEAAERVAFGPASGADDLDVASPWPDVERVERAVRTALPWWRRVLWSVDPRPLLKPTKDGSPGMSVGSVLVSGR